MYFCLVISASFFRYGGHAVVTVDDLDIFIAQILAVAVDKTIIPALHGVIPDTVTVQDIDLHTVVGHEIMSASAGDPAGRVIEQVIQIEDKKIRRRKKVIEEPGTDIDRRCEIDRIVPKIKQADPFGKGQAGCIVVAAKRDGRIRKKPSGRQIGAVRGAGIVVTSQTYVFIAIS